MAEETVIVEVEPESIKHQLIDVTVLGEELPDNMDNSERTNVVAKDEQIDKKDVKKSLVWDEQFDVRHVRRHSASLANRKLVVPSRYRGGSVGSCHDMCKFGHRNTSEVKPKVLLKKTPLSVGSSQVKGPMKIGSSVDNRKKPVVRRLSFPATQMPVADAGKAKKKTAESVETVEKQDNKCHDFKEIDVVIKDKEKSLRSKPPVKKAAASMNSRIHRDLSSSSNLKNHQTDRQKEVKSKLPEEVLEKTLYTIEPDGKNTPAETSQRKKLPKTEGGSYIGTKKGTKATLSRSFSKSLFSSSSKSFKWKSEKLDDAELKTKRTATVYGIRKSKSNIQEATTTTSTPKVKLGAPNINSKNKPNAPKVKPSILTPRSKPGTPKVKQDGEPKIKAGVKSQNGEGQGFVSVWKMKFRRGKVVSLPSGNNSPKVLKFRRPTTFSESHHDESAGKAKYKSNEVVGDDHDPHKDGAEAVKVILRRQEVTYKKDDVDLNNVIEETASKLVKTRKSKVKALVGAFETVMLLRERKPATNTS